MIAGRTLKVYRQPDGRFGATPPTPDAPQFTALLPLDLLTVELAPASEGLKRRTEEHHRQVLRAQERLIHGTDVPPSVAALERVMFPRYTVEFDGETSRSYEVKALPPGVPEDED